MSTVLSKTSRKDGVEIEIYSSSRNSDPTPDLGLTKSITKEGKKGKKENKKMKQTETKRTSYKGKTPLVPVQELAP
jgi:hypothetical protein